jgi:nucleotide-binding universal stress UspA family protein
VTPLRSRPSSPTRTSAVLLTHVHPYGRLANLLSGGQYAVLARDVADATFAAVQETLAPASQRDLRLVSNSSPAAGLQLIAEETGASIIVVGSSHRSRLDRVLSGSVTESMLTGAPVPVAVAPRHYSGTDRARLDRLVLRLDHALMTWTTSVCSSGGCR